MMEVMMKKEPGPDIANHLIVILKELPSRNKTEDTRLPERADKGQLGNFGGCFGGAALWLTGTTWNSHAAFEPCRNMPSPCFLGKKAKMNEHTGPRLKGA